MSSEYYIQDVIKRLSTVHNRSVEELPILYKPRYEPRESNGLDTIESEWPYNKMMLAVASMKYHTTNEGYEIALALEHSGYKLAGHGFLLSETNVPTLISNYNPETVIVQDKREWEGLTAGGPRGFDTKERFNGVEVLKSRLDIFKMTILKDAQHRLQYHRDSALEIGCNGWIIYYNPIIVKHLAPYVRQNHLVRLYHTIDRNIVPEYDLSTAMSRRCCIISGAVSNVYPLRRRLFEAARLVPFITPLHHPGYHRNGCHTPEYLQELSKYKIAICTSSIYGYSLRKIIEATACGCVVLTDLPVDEKLPHIDDNLARVHPDWSMSRILSIIKEIEKTYDPSRQNHFSEIAKDWYDYRSMGKRLSRAIDNLKSRYNSNVPV